MFIPSQMSNISFANATFVAQYVFNVSFTISASLGELYSMSIFGNAFLYIFTTGEISSILLPKIALDWFKKSFSALFCVRNSGLKIEKIKQLIQKLNNI